MFVAGVAVLDHLPHALRLQGWLEDAYAATPNVVQQTMNGLVAFIVPGRDRYSRAQGTKSQTRGGIEAGTTPVLMRTLDRFLPGPLPLSATAATILNEFAAQVDPASRNGTFASPFANLSFAKKARVFQTIESLPAESAGSIRFLAGNLPDLVAFLAYSEAGVSDSGNGPGAKRKRWSTSSETISTSSALAAATSWTRSSRPYACAISNARPAAGSTLPSVAVPAVTYQLSSRAQIRAPGT